MAELTRGTPVRFSENADTGVVEEIGTGSNAGYYFVAWDDGGDDDWYLRDELIELTPEEARRG